MQKQILTGLLIAGSLVLGGCNEKTDPQKQLVSCEGVSKFGPAVPVMMTKGMCEKIAGGKAMPVTSDNYVECYGVAAAGKNDCATNSAACAGTATVDHSPDSWIAVPKGICEQLQGGKAEALSKNKKSPPVKS